jgi:hypothetical protein
MRTRRPCPAPAARSAFARFRFPPEVIAIAVRWYLRYGLSYRDVEELLAERGVEVDHVTIYRWVQRFTPLLADAARPCRHAVGDRWFADETYVKVAADPMDGGGQHCRIARDLELAPVLRVAAQAAPCGVCCMAACTARA